MSSRGAGASLAGERGFSGLEPAGNELGLTDDPRALVAGDPEAVSRTIDGLATVGDAVDRTGDGLRRIDTASVWSGPASEAFREYFDSKPRLWAELAEALSGAAGALVPYRDTLRWAQDEAASAIATFAQGERVTEAAKREYRAALEAYEQALASGGVASAPPVFEDPGEALRDEARQRLERARDRLAEQAAETAGQAGRHRDGLPDQPGVIRRLVVNAVDNGKFQLTQVADLVAGAWQAVTDFATIAAAVNPTSAYNLTHPQQYAENLHTIAQGLGHGVTHPVELAKAIVQWDTWTDSPGRAIGNLLPDLLAGLLSGGASAAGRVGVTAGRLGRSAVRDAAETGGRHADDAVAAGRPDGVRPDPGVDAEPGPDFGPHGGDSYQPQLRADHDAGHPREPEPQGSQEPYPDHDDPYNPPELDTPAAPAAPSAPAAPAAAGNSDPNWDYDDPFHPADLGAEPVDRRPVADAAPIAETSRGPTLDAPRGAPDYLDNPDYEAHPVVHCTYLDQFGPITDQQRHMLEGWRQEHTLQVGRLEDTELLALDRYQGHHAEINQALREHDLEALDDLDAQIREVVSGLNKLPAYEGVVFRGVSVDPGDLAGFLDAYRPGEFIREPAFLSADMAVPYPGNVQFVIDSLNGAYVPRLSDGMFGLHEVMWPPGSMFQVRDVAVDEVTDVVTIRLGDLPRS